MDSASTTRLVAVKGQIQPRTSIRAQQMQSNPNEVLQEISQNPNARQYYAGIFYLNQQLKNIGENDVVDPDSRIDTNKVFEDLTESHNQLVAKVIELADHPDGLDHPELEKLIDEFTNKFLGRFDEVALGEILNPDAKEDEQVTVSELTTNNIYFYLDSIRKIYTQRNKGEEDSNLSDFGKYCFEKISKSNEALLDWIVKTPDGDLKKEKIYQTLVRILRDSYNRYSLHENKAEIASLIGISTGSRAFFNMGPMLLRGVFGNEIGDESNAEDKKTKYEEFVDGASSALMSEAAYLGGSFVNTYANNRSADFSKKLANKVNRAIADTLLFKELEFGEGKSIAEIVTILNQGKNSLNKLIGYMAETFIPGSLGLGMSFAALGYLHPALLLAVPMNLGMTYMVNKGKTDALKEEQLQANIAEETVARAIQAIHASLLELKASPEITEIRKALLQLEDNVGNKTQDVTKSMNWTKFRAGIPTTITLILTGLGGLALKANDLISKGAVVASFMYSNMMVNNFDYLQKLYFTEFPKLLQDIERMNELLDSLDPSRLPDSEEEIRRFPVSVLNGHAVSAKDLYFHDVLVDIDVNVNQGEYVILTGDNGIGKSVFIKNILGLYRDKDIKGNISIGETNIKDIKRYGSESIYSMVAYCPQRPVLLDGFSLRENLCLGSHKDISDERIQELLKDIELGEFVDKLDDKSIRPSGGQLMKLGLVRALLKDPKILVLDEPTNDIDAKSKVALFAAIDRMRAKDPNLTVIAITHDEILRSRSDVREIDFNKVNERRNFKQ